MSTEVAGNRLYTLVLTKLTELWRRNLTETESVNPELKQKMRTAIGSVLSFAKAIGEINENISGLDASNQSYPLVRVDQDTFWRSEFVALKPHQAVNLGLSMVAQKATELEPEAIQMLQQKGLGATEAEQIASHDIKVKLEKNTIIFALAPLMELYAEQFEPSLAQQDREEELRIFSTLSPDEYSSVQSYKNELQKKSNGLAQSGNTDSMQAARLMALLNPKWYETPDVIRMRKNKQSYVIVPHREARVLGVQILRDGQVQENPLEALSVLYSESITQGMLNYARRQGD